MPIQFAVSEQRDVLVISFSGVVQPADVEDVMLRSAEALAPGVEYVSLLVVEPGTDLSVFSMAMVDRTNRARQAQMSLIGALRRKGAVLVRSARDAEALKPLWAALNIAHEDDLTFAFFTETDAALAHLEIDPEVARDLLRDVAGA
jgi:hypothetical protein